MASKYNSPLFLIGLLTPLLGGQACGDIGDLDDPGDEIEDLEPRIIDGQLTSAWEAVVAVRKNAPGGWCTGTQITDALVLTAAHCMTFIDDAGDLQVIDPTTVQVYWGEHASAGIFGDSDPTMLGLRGTTEVLIHPEFDGLVGGADDLALLVLDGPGFAKPLPIRTEDEPVPNGEIMNLVGFGVFGFIFNPDGSFNLQFDTRKREGQAPLADSATLFPGFPGEKGEIYAADGAGAATNMCFGDSGGPLVANLGGEDVVIGVASYVNVQFCSEGSFFARVDVAEDFIDDNVDIIPNVECVDTSGGGTHVAHFGYENPAGWTVKRPLGPSNTLVEPGSIGPSTPAPPTTFASGHQPDAFSVEYPAGGTVVWTLGDRTASTDDITTPCP